MHKGKQQVANGAEKLSVKHRNFSAQFRSFWGAKR